MYVECTVFRSRQKRIKLLTNTVFSYILLENKGSRKEKRKVILNKKQERAWLVGGNCLIVWRETELTQPLIVKSSDQVQAVFLVIIWRGRISSQYWKFHASKASIR